MPILHFQRAVREGSHVLLGLYGESGSGKTYSALKLARGLVGAEGRIAVIDTETGRALTYANVAAPWDWAELTPPFSPERYVEALADVEAAGYDVVIIDSASHEWDSLGGVLEQADENPKLKGLVKWAKPKAKHKRWVQALLRSRLHVILCLRAKEKLVQKKVPDSRTGEMKDEIVSAGYAPVQDKRFIYEVTCQLFLPVGERRGVPVVEKCPEDLLPAFPEGEQISERTGERIRQWLQGAAPVDYALVELKRKAEDEAGRGTDEFRIWWQALPKADRDRLRSHVPNLQSIAEEADRRVAEDIDRSHDDGEDAA